MNGRVVDCNPAAWAEVDAAIAAETDSAIDFLSKLVRARSTLGMEAAAQDVVAAELAKLGFEVARLPIPEVIATTAPAGVAQTSYAGRSNVVGRINPGCSPSLLLNGHVDVVPAEAALWSSDPYLPQQRHGWLTGRGAGDMKGGIAMGLLAVAALRRAMPQAIAGELAFVSVIEEECTGNGTFAAATAGVLGDAVVVLEPTGLDLLLGGVGILWIEICLEGVAAHAESADRAANPISSVPVILAALERLETQMREATDDAPFRSIASPYNVNVGTIRAGDWPSSVPGRAVLGVRIGFPRCWTPADACGRVAAAISEAAAADPWLAEHPPVLREAGFRAEGFLLPDDHPLAEAMARAHAAANGAPPRRTVIGATMDARYYLNQFGRPALAYGPTARNIHAADEAVELGSIVRGARTLARFVATYFADGG
ncbi:MAG: M20/M25/M40 family metallo-hydrolase, partial [Streptosporangiaceae bacterium]